LADRLQNVLANRTIQCEKEEVFFREHVAVFFCG
jgi:hypothetical protein